MAQELKTGKLTEDSFVFKEITWEIPNVMSLPKLVDYEVRSHEFSLANSTWALSMNPYGQTSYDSTSYIDINIYRLHSPKVEQKVHWKIFLKTSKGKEFKPYSINDDFTSTRNWNGLSKYLIHSKLVEMKNFLAPQGTLTVICQMRIKSTVADEVTPQVKIVSPVTIAETLGESSKDSKKCIDVHTQTEVEFVTGSDEFKAAAPEMKFAHDYQKLLLSGEDCDVTLQVKGKKFEAHRIILKARSPVFACMLKHNMKEKNTGVIDIEDCDPEYFSDFLRFLYCGSVEIITPLNACSLYRVADKYDVQDLRHQCLAFIKSHLDVDNFCDVITLALQRNMADLVKQATNFFADNMLKIVVTVKWQIFLSENTTEGNELIIKAAKKFTNP